MGKLSVGIIIGVAATVLAFMYFGAAEDSEVSVPDTGSAVPSTTTESTLSKVDDSGSSSEEPAADQRESGDAALRAWPVPPESMESLLNRAIAGLPEIFTYSAAECDSTHCEIRFESGDWGSIAAGSLRFLLDPPYSAELGEGSKVVDPTCILPEPKGCSYEHTVTVRINQNPGPRPVEMSRMPYALSADQLRRLAESNLPSDSHDAPPVMVNELGRSRLFVENVCSIDCPLDTEKLIYIDVQPGQACEELRGVERVINARSPDGTFRERTFCVPNTLIEP